MQEVSSTHGLRQICRTQEVPFIELKSTQRASYAASLRCWYNEYHWQTQETKFGAFSIRI